MANKSTYMPKPGVVNTPLQQLAQKRNWDKLQIKGSTGQLRHQVLNAALPPVVRSYMLTQLNAMEEQLTTALDKKWKQDKVVFAQQVQEEVFGKTEAVAAVYRDPLPSLFAEPSVELPPTQDNKVAAVAESEAKTKAKAKREKINKAASDF